jgi:hypothetical protein
VQGLNLMQVEALVLGTQPFAKLRKITPVAFKRVA